MAVSVRIEFNDAGFKALKNSDGLAGYLLDQAKQCKARAEAIAPDAPPVGVGYRQSFVTYVATTDRKVGRLGNTAPYALYVEFGTSKMQGQRVLGRSVDGVGAAGGG